MASHGLRWTYGNGDTQHFDARRRRPHERPLNASSSSAAESATPSARCA